ncbi:MAG: RNA polymerase sigma factor [Coprobacillaceae bacterium]
MFFNKNKDPNKITLTNEDAIDYFSDTVYKVALSMTKKESDAQDIFQEVFLRFVKRDDTFDSIEHAKAWFIRVTINCCNTFFKKNQKQPEAELVVEVPDEDEQQHEITYLVQELEEKYRVVIHLFYYEQYAIKEIADILKENENTIKTRLSRAKKY